MDVDIASVDYISRSIKEVVGPSFMLIAVSGLLSMLSGRLNGDLENLRRRSSLFGDMPVSRGHGQAAIARLRRRIEVMHQAMLMAIFSGIATALLIITAFAVTMFSIEGPWGSAGLFVIALVFYCGSLIMLAISVVHSAADTHLEMSSSQKAVEGPSLPDNGPEI